MTDYPPSNQGVNTPPASDLSTEKAQQCANPECDHDRTIPSPGCAFRGRDQVDVTPPIGASATESADLWVEYGKHNNGLWIDAHKVATVRNIGKGGKRGSVLALDNGHSFITGYPATQLVAMVRAARVSSPPGEQGGA